MGFELARWQADKLREFVVSAVYLDECMTEMRDVRLPADLCSAAEKKFSRAFASLEELLVFILRDLSLDQASQLDQAEQRLVEERLRELGYL